MDLSAYFARFGLSDDDASLVVVGAAADTDRFAEIPRDLLRDPDWLGCTLTWSWSWSLARSWSLSLARSRTLTLTGRVGVRVRAGMGMGRRGSLRVWVRHGPPRTRGWLGIRTGRRFAISGRPGGQVRRWAARGLVAWTWTLSLALAWSLALCAIGGPIALITPPRAGSWITSRTCPRAGLGFGARAGRLFS